MQPFTLVLLVALLASGVGCSQITGELGDAASQAQANEAPGNEDEPTTTVLLEDQLAHQDRGWWRDWATLALPGIPSNAPGFLTLGPLKLFSLSEVDPGGTFEMHHHEGAEVITVMIEGTMERRDTGGSTGVHSASDVYVLSAGRGVDHEEGATDDGKVLALVLFLESERPGDEPSFAEGTFPRMDREDRLIPLVSGQGHEGALRMKQDAVLLSAMLEEDGQITHRLAPGRAAYIMPLSGEVTVSGTPVPARARYITRVPGLLMIAAGEPTEVFVLDLPASD